MKSRHGGDRSRKGNTGEADYKRLWLSLHHGGAMLDLSPQEDGADLLGITGEALELVEVKDKDRSIGGKELETIILKLRKHHIRLSSAAPVDLLVRARFVHRRGPEAEFVTLWSDER